MPIPTKSAVDCGADGGVVVEFFSSSLTCFASMEVAPKTVGMSIAMFSRIVFAVATAPKLQPALVNGTQGAGAFLPSPVSMLGFVSVGALVVGSKIVEVQ